MAFVLTLLVMLLVGTVTAAIAFGQSNSIQNAAREASRYAATLPDGGASLGWFQDIQAVARAAAAGDLEPGVPNAAVCVAFVNADDTATRVDNDGVIESGSCYDDGRNGKNETRVQVVTQRDAEINAVLFPVDVTLEAPASARYER